MRWTKQVATGMDLIYSYMSCELENGELSAIECRKQYEPNDDGSANNVGPCDRCEGCRNQEALGKALSYLGAIIDSHKTKGE